MKRQEISRRAHSPASPDAVYSLLTDGSTWPIWSPIGSFALEQPGPDGGEGVGAVRVFRTGRTTSREEIVELQPNRRFGYALLSGLPLRDYRADVDLAPGADGGTDIHWHSSFTAKVPGTGWLWRWMLGRFIKRCAHGLATHAAHASVAHEPRSR